MQRKEEGERQPPPIPSLPGRGWPVPLACHLCPIVLWIEGIRGAVNQRVVSLSNEYIVAILSL